MTRFITWVLMTTLAFSLILGAVRARATPDDMLRDILLPPEGCASPCWMGIQAGVTTADEAEAILRAHPWVASTHRTPLNISWRWNSEQPSFFANDAQGLIYLRSENAPIVSTLRIALTTRFGDAWALFGVPGSAQLIRPSRSTAYMVASFAEAGVTVIAGTSCPAKPSSYWNGLLSLHVGELTFTEVMHNVPYNIFRKEGWWQWMGRCHRVVGL
jgi:hypothetical protein